jgi:hypothetical protein
MLRLIKDWERSRLSWECGERHRIVVVVVIIIEYNSRNVTALKVARQCPLVLVVRYAVSNTNCRWRRELWRGLLWGAASEISWAFGPNFVFTVRWGGWDLGRILCLQCGGVAEIWAEFCVYSGVGWLGVGANFVVTVGWGGGRGE